jgi:hypothetical protein
VAISVLIASAAFLQSSSDANGAICVVVGLVGLPKTIHSRETKRTHSTKRLPLSAKHTTAGVRRPGYFTSFTPEHLSIAPVPIRNSVRWWLIENGAVVLLDVGLVQTDLWDGDRSATVARNAGATFPRVP